MKMDDDKKKELLEKHNIDEDYFNYNDKKTIETHIIDDDHYMTIIIDDQLRTWSQLNSKSLGSLGDCWRQSHTQGDNTELALEKARKQIDYFKKLIHDYKYGKKWEEERKRIKENLKIAKDISM